jgi:hypothetical protein
MSRRLLLLGPLCAMLLSGCGGGATRVGAKVISGDISFVVVADQSDPRLKGEGIAGATIQVHGGAERGGALLGSAKSDAKGNLTISIKDNSVLMRPAEFSATAEGFGPASSVMQIPPADKRLLFILKPAGAAPPKGGG